MRAPDNTWVEKWPALKRASLSGVPDCLSYEADDRLGCIRREDWRDVVESDVSSVDPACIRARCNATSSPPGFSV